ncbi:MAG: glutamate 5-kinase [Pontimonas sp.]
MTRETAHTASRVVIKVGSSSISGEREHQVPGLVDALAAWHAAGSEVILVSSGAIAIGAPFLKLSDRPQDLATQQAAAAVGQNLLMGRYQALFEKYSIITGQVLLTVGDMENGTHRTNALRTIERLLGLGIIPIVNENDTVATQEIRFGDNDRLAALVSELVGADLLVLLSDVDALYSHPPTDSRAQRIDAVTYGDTLEGVELGEALVNSVGTGGAVTKVSAAKMATAAGIPTLLSSTESLGAIVAGEPLGTWFEPADLH